MLKLPPTLREAHEDDMPHREDIQELLTQRRMANITQGYKITLNKTPQLPYTFSAEININNDKLWQLFMALSDALPAEVACVYGQYDDDEEPTTSGYFDKAFVLETLSRFKNELMMDCNLSFGLLSQSREQLIEIFVTETKYIRFWGIDKAGFQQTMQAFNLTEIKDLAFVDEYPKVTIPLRDVLPKANRPGEVVRALNKAFGVNA